MLSYFPLMKGSKDADFSALLRLQYDSHLSLLAMPLEGWKQRIWLWGCHGKGNFENHSHTHILSSEVKILPKLALSIKSKALTH